MTVGRSAVFLEQMRTAAERAISFVDGYDRIAFLTDDRTQQAVVMSLMIIGEAAARILHRDPSFAERHPAVPWIGMRGMRNRVAHGYFAVDMDVV